MKPEISKSARDLLAKQPAAEPHPSPDLLNGYVEQALDPAENTQVMTHLSACAECREVVFLAGGAAEQEIQPDILVALPKANPSLARVPAQMTAMQVGAEAEPTKPKPPWAWWKWAAPLAAIVIIGSTVLIERDRIVEMMMGPPSTRMANVAGQATGTPGPPAAKPSPLPKPLAAANPEQPNTYALRLDKAAGEEQLQERAAYDAKKKNPVAKAQAAPKEDAIRRKTLEAQIASNLQNPGANAIAAPESKPKTAQVASTATTAEVTSAAPLVQADNADLSTTGADAMKPESLAKSSLVANNQAVGAVAAMPMARHQAAANSHWRIGSEGQLERSTGAGTWTQKLASGEVTFRAVATVGSDVWAGGNGGALFHSSDGGEHFNKVVLSANGQTERGAIVSIHFDTAQQGRVISDTGATWTTTDGGQSWSKQ